MQKNQQQQMFILLEKKNHKKAFAVCRSAKSFVCYAPNYNLSYSMQAAASTEMVLDSSILRYLFELLLCGLH